MESVANKPKALRLVILEDNRLDAELTLRKLNEAGLAVDAIIARTGAEFRTFCLSEPYDLMIGDYHLPDWSGLDAVRWLRSAGVLTPFILVTGTLGDELAIECVKAGADDYILKDRLDRLPFAVQKALTEQQLRRERDWAERELRDSEYHYRLLFYSNPHPMWVFDAESLRFLAVNDAAVRQYGYSTREFLGMTVVEIRPPEEAERLRARVREGTFATAPHFREAWTHRKKDGTLIEVEISAQPIVFRQVRAMLVLATDMTEYRKLEQQFRHAQKMEAIGRLAGGVAHDFNNLLMVISSNAELAQSHLDNRVRANGYFQHIEYAVEKAALLTRQLLAFGRKQLQDLRVLDLNVVVPEFAAMLPPLVGEDIEVIVRQSAKDCRVHCDRTQIEQVIMNLVVNSRDAMPKGGKLIIELDRVHLDGQYFAQHSVQAQSGEYVMLAVTDTGVGMDESTQTKAFEPFFTTKEVGKGTGLGLSTVYGIVKQSGGYTWLYSEPRVGTTFKIYLPYAAEHIEVLEPIEPAESIEPSGHETILLVEDQAALRAGISEFLQTRGYNVLQATTGAEALLKASTYAGRIDLLLTDVVMPGISGQDLAAALLRSRPEIAVIYMSGYTEQSVKREDFERPGFYIQKPFTFRTLSAIVRQALGSRAPGQFSLP